MVVNRRQASGHVMSVKHEKMWFMSEIVVLNRHEVKATARVKC